MLDKQIQIYAKTFLKDTINKSFSDNEIKKIVSKHNLKSHFIPLKYRVAAGVIQSLNIKFGNFLEEFLRLIISSSYSEFELVNEYLSTRKNKFSLRFETDDLIDKYITKQQIESQNVLEAFTELKNNITKLASEPSSDNKIIKHDIDLLFKNDDKKIIYYVEVKYNDDHDSGKFIDINRKIIKTYAYLEEEFADKNYKIIPILYYFNKGIKSSVNPYLPADNIMYGSDFFERFTSIKYADVIEFIQNLSSDPEITELFNTWLSIIFNGHF
ncbi:HinfI family type II restriction enzyme [Mycoplasma sp. VS42A]|uniref:HinfI family type II restriction enzyme n=1 Tax=unclassified Mycoplasma TaxID=2683645 RepID=UPI003A83DC1E